MKHKYLLPMQLQFFAEGDGVGGEDQGDGAGGGEGNKNDTGAGEGGAKEGEKTFDDILKDGFQAEFDRRVQKALETQKTKMEALMDDKLSEAERLSKMNKEEREQYQREKREKELEEKEAAITKRELMAEAKSMLSDKELPLSLAELVNYKDADTCKASIDAIEKAFQEAVEKAVAKRLEGGKPPKKAPGSGADGKEDEAVSFAKGIAKAAVQTETVNKAQDYYFK